jgi:hypothetical protein
MRTGRVGQSWLLPVAGLCAAFAAVEHANVRQITESACVERFL